MNLQGRLEIQTMTLRVCGGRNFTDTVVSHILHCRRGRRETGRAASPCHQWDSCSATVLCGYWPCAAGVISVLVVVIWVPLNLDFYLIKQNKKSRVHNLNRKMRMYSQNGSISSKESKQGCQSSRLQGGTCIPSWEQAARAGPFSPSALGVGAQVSWGRAEPRCPTTWAMAELQYWRESGN